MRRPYEPFRLLRFLTAANFLAFFLVLSARCPVTVASPSAYPYEDMPEVEPDVYITRDRHIRLTKRKRGSTSSFEHQNTQTRLNYVTDSGICETTPGVKQYSGYMTVGQNMNMWFWMFEARKDPTNAPLVAWFNGGPGCSSMIGLFQEHGPCQFYNGSKTPELNKYSWNEYANMIYIDQPIGTGFSYGTSNTSSSLTASPYVWKLIQNVYAAFPQYKSRAFGIFTESYGGHYGPEFTRYILEKNGKIEKGTEKGEKINIVALGINNGWINPGDNYRGMIEFAASNPYKKLISTQSRDTYTNTLQSRCMPLLQQCWQSDSNSDCSRANTGCKLAIENSIIRGGFNVYDVRQPASMKDIDPPETYVPYLQTANIQQAIGAKKKYEECPNGPMRKFSATGDDSRNFAPALAKIVQAGVNVLIWAGDTDWICNWQANLLTANSLQYSGRAAFVEQELKPYTVDGVQKGEYKTEGNLSFLKVTAAGHEAAYYQPEVSLQAFIQTMQKKGLKPT